jgi:hypothetical protein
MMLNGAAFYVYYAVQLNRIKTTMREKIRNQPESELQKLIVSRAEFENGLVDDHELRIKGRMYDISRVRYLDDTVIVLCLRDEKEERLVAFISALVSAPFENDELPSSITQFLTLIYLVPETELRFQQLDQMPQRHDNSIVDVLSAKTTNESPPPEIVQSSICHHSMT